MPSSRKQQRDKKVFFMNKEKNCREIQQNEKNQRSRQENWRYHVKMGMIKHRKGKNLTGGEEIKKWQEYKSQWW